MAASSNPVEQAFRRCDLLARLIQLEYDRARANPTDARYAKLGITELGAKVNIDEATRQIDEVFGDLVALVDHLSILDMAAAFEWLFNARIGTAVGTARKTLREKHRRPALAGRARLVRNTTDFEGLRDITTLIDADLSQQVIALLNTVRENRNRFAHGTDIRNPPTILKNEALAALNEALDLL